MSYHCAIRKWTEVFVRTPEDRAVGWIAKFDNHPGHYALTINTLCAFSTQPAPEDLDAGPFDTFEEARAVLLAIHALQGKNT